MTDPIADPVRLSLEVGLLCALLGLPLAVAFGWLLSRRRFPGKALVGSVILGPMAARLLSAAWRYSSLKVR